MVDIPSNKPSKFKTSRIMLLAVEVKEAGRLVVLRSAKKARTPEAILGYSGFPACRHRERHEGCWRSGYCKISAEN